MNNNQISNEQQLDNSGNSSKIIQMTVENLSAENSHQQPTNEKVSENANLNCNNSNNNDFNKMAQNENNLNDNTYDNQSIDSNIFSAFTKFEFKSAYYIFIRFILLALILLPIQYHNENFGIQMKIIRDACLGAHRTSSLNKSFIEEKANSILFKSSSWNNIEQELRTVEKIEQNKNFNNMTFKYMSYRDCLKNNFTNLVNIVTTQKTASRILLHHSRSMHATNHTLVIICNDEAYMKYIENENYVVSLGDKIDFESNIMEQWNISCKNATSSAISVSYAQMTHLSGQIIGSIVFSMLADYAGRKRVYLITLYLSTIVGLLISIVQTYKQYVIIRLPIAALVQGSWITSFVILFETILKTRDRNTFCFLFLCTQYVANVVVAQMAQLIKDWRYIQLAGSLLSSIAIIYPWVIKEPFKWLIVRGKFDKAEKQWKNLFSNPQIITQFIRFKADEMQSEDYKSTSWWPLLIWQPQFKKLICSFILMWTILSFTLFFINEDPWEIFNSEFENYIMGNVFHIFFHILLSLLCLKFGKRFPLGSCMFLGGSFYLAVTFINQEFNNYVKLTMHIISKCLITYSLNILTLYVCELFPSEIKCSAVSFFLSIKYLSEMFAIYIFKVNVFSMTMIKMGLSIFCVLLCACALLLPDKNLFSFNMDYIDFLNSLNEFIRKYPCQMYQIRADPVQTANLNEDENYMKTINKTISSLNEEDNVVSIAANSLIKKINSENHSKNGKLNPLYEEEHNTSYSSANVCKNTEAHLNNFICTSAELHVTTTKF